MRTREERVEIASAIREIIAAGVGEQLRSLPGVYHVSAGLKERGGRVERTFCIRVYVRRKLPLDRLAPAQRVPRDIAGIPTDVIVMPELSTQDNTAYRPVKGGSLICNGIMGSWKGKVGFLEGTFGCTATRISDGAVVLLTNYHVLKVFGADIGQPVFQPPPNPRVTLDVSDLPWRYPGDENRIAEFAGYSINNMDAAIARLDVSSWCRCCGIDWRDEVLGAEDAAGAVTSHTLKGLRRAEIDDIVYLMGSNSPRSEGIVVEVDSPAFTLDVVGTNVTFTGQIIVRPTDAVFGRYSDDGDSGGVVVDDQDRIVGLHFAGNRKRGSEGMGIASHISDVAARLGITINLDRTADTAGVPLLRPAVRDVERYAAARQRVLAHPAGRWLWQLIEQHREEIVALVTTHRPVTVAWHRAAGPALLAAALKSAASGLDALPTPPDGSSLTAAAARMADALRSHGSSELRADLERAGSRILEALRDCVTVSELLDRLAAAPLPANAPPRVLT